jgi:hypothetical protein
LSGEISFAVGFFRDADYVVGAHGNTKGAALAAFNIDYNFSGHLRIFYRRRRSECRKKRKKYICEFYGLCGNCRSIIPRRPEVVKNNQGVLNAQNPYFKKR